MDINNVIKYPILTEKTYAQMETNVYTFAVDRKASKFQIKQAVEFIFNVKVGQVNTFNVPKKAVKVGRYQGYSNAFKRAIVTVVEGQIRIFPEEGIASDKELEAQKAKTAKQEAKAAALEAKISAKIEAKKRAKEEKEAKKALKSVAKAQPDIVEEKPRVIQDPAVEILPGALKEKPETKTKKTPAKPKTTTPKVKKDKA